MKMKKYILTILVILFIGSTLFLKEEPLLRYTLACSAIILNFYNLYCQFKKTKIVLKILYFLVIGIITSQYLIYDTIKFIFSFEVIVYFFFFQLLISYGATLHSQLLKEK